MTRHYIAYIIALMLCSASFLSAQTPASQQVSGLVTERLSGEAVIGVSVLLVKDTANITSTTILRGARTNKFGFYSLTDVPEGAYFLVVRGLGFRTFVQAVALRR